MDGDGPIRVCSAILNDEFSLGADASTLSQTRVWRKPPLLPPSKRAGRGRRGDPETATGATLPDGGASILEHVCDGPPAEWIALGQEDSGESEDDPVTDSPDTCCLGGRDSAPEQAEFGDGGAQGRCASGKFSERIANCNLGQDCASERPFVISANRLKFHALCSRIPS